MSLDRGARDDKRQRRALQKLNADPADSVDIFLDDLEDVTITSPANDHILVYSAGLWVNAPASLNIFSDVQYAFPAAGDILVWDVGLNVFTNIPFLTSGNTKILASYLTETIALADLTDVTAVTGTGTTVVLNSSPTIVTPTIASFTNAQHNHQNAAGGGTLTAAAVAAAGSTTQVQVNLAGAFAGDADFTFDASTNVVNIGSSTATTKGHLTPNQAQTRPGILITGTGTDGVGDATGGFGMWLTHNASGNRQMVFGSSDAFNLSTRGAFRFLDLGALIPSIDGVTGDGSTRTNMNLGTDTTGVAVGNFSLAYNATIPGKLSVYAEASGVGLNINLGSSGTGDLARFSNNSGTKQSSVDSAGNIVTNVAGVGFKCKEGTNACMGVATLVAGVVTVNTTKVTASSRILLTSQSDGGTVGFLRITARTAGTSFTVTSSSVLDTSTFAWIIVEPSP